MANSLDTVNV